MLTKLTKLMKLSELLKSKDFSERVLFTNIVLG
jgi:hypothetical protein